MTETTGQLDLVDALLQAGVLAEERSAELRERLRSDWRPPIRVILDGGVEEADLLPVAGEWLGLPVEDSLEQVVAPDAFFRVFPPEYARQAGVVATRMDEETLDAALALSEDLAALRAELRLRFARRVRCVLAPRREIEKVVDRQVRQRRSYLDHAAGELDGDEVREADVRVEGVTDFGELMRKTPVVKLVALLVAQAVRTGASDIHFQPTEDRLIVRFRTDGILHDILELPRSSQDAILSRVKVLGRMDIAERRAPQDGRASFRYADRDVDVRMSVVPTSEGERAVLRLLDKDARPLALDDLGLDAGKLARFEALVRSPNGMILATGPTGSGKNTTLHAGLMRINSRETNIITIEDPVEYKLPGASQIQVNTKKGVTFGSMLRSVVRQDPDVIMIGEIRDAETAASAIQSAMTGHLVLSTLHTNDSAGAIARLRDLQVEPFYIVGSLLGILAQRLARRVCANCAEPGDVPAALAKAVGLTPEDVERGAFRHGAGCEQCLGTGYRGRIGLFELMVLDDPLRELVSRGASTTELRNEAVRRGMTLLRDDGLAKAMAGVTTVEEVLRVTQADGGDTSG